MLDRGATPRKTVCLRVQVVAVSSIIRPRRCNRSWVRRSSCANRLWDSWQRRRNRVFSSLVQHPWLRQLCRPRPHLRALSLNQAPIPFYPDHNRKVSCRKSMYNSTPRTMIQIRKLSMCRRIGAKLSLRRRQKSQSCRRLAYSKITE